MKIVRTSQALWKTVAEKDRKKFLGGILFGS
jgi:hypothetical protein